MNPTENNQDSESAESKDQIIADLMEQRKLQQEALLKIMTSMDKDMEAVLNPAGEQVPRKKRLLEKIFSTDKKTKK